MVNIKELPENYKKAMQELLGYEYEDYIRTLGGRAFAGVRANTLKLDGEELQNLLGSRLRAVDWVPDAYYTGEDRKLSKSPYYYAGLYYLQEPSAMTPAALSGVEPGDRVLDLCAAPGGKSTQLAGMLKGRGLLVSNDLSNSRAKALLKNIELSGAGNVLITCEEPKALASVYKDYFDKILVDAPCSGEGMFRRDTAVFNAYLKRGPEHFAPIQAEILNEAAKMLKPGGHIIYSTCTYSRIEDEETVMNFLESHPDFCLDSLPLHEGFTSSSILPGSVRLFPHKIDGEGHFVAKIKRKADSHNEPELKGRGRGGRKVRLPAELLEFLKNTDRAFNEGQFYINREYIYYLPEDCLTDEKIRYLRTGLLLGRSKNKRFEPSQALAMNLKPDEWKNPVNLDIEDERVIRYLKGETVGGDSEGSGYRLLCVSGYPLGFIKQEGMRWKNKYYPGWRWQ